MVLITGLNAPRADAAINKQVNFQGRLTDAAGVAVADGAYNLEFKLHNDPATAGGAQGVCAPSCVWMETRTLTNRVTVTRGLFSVQLGSVAALSAFNFDQDPLYVSIRVGGTADTPVWDGEMTPRQRLGAAPTAIHSANSSLLEGQNGAYYLNSANLTGTLADGRLSSNVALRNANNNFSVGQTVTGTLTATDLTCADCINAADLASGSVASAEILDNTIAAVDIAPDAVTASEIATSGVTTTEILDATITNADLAQTVWSTAGHQVGITLPLAAASNNGQLFLDTDDDGGTLYRSNGTAWVKAARGANEATSNDLVCTGCVNTTDILDSTITGTDVADGTIAAADLGAGLAMPVGAIVPYWGTVLPANYAWADGASMSCTTYVALCATRGASGSIVLPDLRGRAPVGVDGTAARLAVSADTLGAGGGEEQHTLTSSEMPAHSHAAGTLQTPFGMRPEIQYVADAHNQYTGLAGWGAVSGWGPTLSNTVGGSTAATGNGSAHNVMQPYQMVNYIIRVA